jgi:hypothetical protein
MVNTPGIRLESSAFFAKDKLQHEGEVIAVMLHFLHRED